MGPGHQCPGRNRRAVAALSMSDRLHDKLCAMQLRNARLCLDCEELHEDPQCPICASESFAYLSRWIPVEERRSRRRSVRPASAPKSPVTRWAQRGAVGLAAIALSGWLWQSSRPESPAEEGDDQGEE